jgi:hypothetical protein
MEGYMEKITINKSHQAETKVIRYFCDRCGFEIDNNHKPCEVEVKNIYDKRNATYQLCRYCNRDMRWFLLHGLCKLDKEEYSKVKLDRASSADYIGGVAHSPWEGTIGRNTGSLKIKGEIIEYNDDNQDHTPSHLKQD